MLISRGCELNTTDSNGDSLLHLCARSSLENACLFLVNKNAETNSLNGQVKKINTKYRKAPIIRPGPKKACMQFKTFFMLR
jgi:hypothetical protein